MSGAFGGLIYTAVNIIASLLQLSILLRHLPLEIAGIWIVFLNLGGYVLILDMGLSPTLGREISFAAGNSALDEEARNRCIATLIRSCTAVVSLLALVVALLGAVCGWGYLHTISPPQISSAVRSAWFVFITGSALNLVGQGWLAGIYGLGHVFQEKIIRAAGVSIGLLFMAVAVYSRTGFMGLAIAYLLQSVCTLVLIHTGLGRLVQQAGVKGGRDWGAVRGLVKPSLKYGATMLGGLLILQTDNIVIASVLGPTAVPDYQAVAKIITVLMGLSLMLVLSSAPIVSRLYIQGDLTMIVQLIFRNLRFTLATMVILGSVIACFMDKIVSIWLGPHHFVGFPIVWVLLIVMLLEAHHQAMASSTMAAGHIVFLSPALIAGVLNIIFSVAMAHRYGLIGVALGTMMAQVVTNNWYAPYYTLRLFDILLLDHLRSVVLPALGLLAVTLGTALTARWLTKECSDLIAFTLGGATTIVVGFLFYILLMINREERSAFLKWLRAIVNGAATI